MLPREYFADRELSCPCCGLLPPLSFAERLYALRILWGRPLVITSAARCKRRNRLVGGKAGSVHLPAEDRAGMSSLWGGGAVDIRMDRARTDERLALVELAKACGFRGFGFGETFLHIDDGARATITDWRY
jgi:hypothetical protein